MTWQPVGAQTTLPDTSRGPLAPLWLPAPSPRDPAPAYSLAAAGAGAPGVGPGVAGPDLDLGGPNGFHPAAAAALPRPASPSLRLSPPGARLGLRSLAADGPQAAMAAGAGARPAPRWLKALAEPLSAAQLRRLEEHRYSAAGVSVLEPPLQLYWTWLLQWIPLWVAPNSITLLGLAVNLLTTLVLIFYCPTATEEVGRPPPPAPASAAEGLQLLFAGVPRSPLSTTPAAEAPGERGGPPRG